MKKVLSVAILAALSGSAQAASFACDKAKTDVEKLICASPELSRLDEQLAGAYKNSTAEENYGFAQEFQRQWLRQRNKCKDEACVRDAYESRLRELRLEPLDSHDFLTGNYSFGKGKGYQGYGYLVKLAPDRFRYELYVTSGEPAWHTGGAAGEARIDGKTARTMPAASTCRLRFRIDGDKVAVSHVNGTVPGDCAMGARVSMDATFVRN